MVLERHGNRYTSRFKLQVLLEVLKGSKNIGRVARSNGIHPITLIHWEKESMEKGPKSFGQKTTLQEYEKRIQGLERLVGRKEVGGDCTFKNLLGRELPREEKIELVRAYKRKYGLNRVLKVCGPSKRTWYYAMGRRRYE